LPKNTIDGNDLNVGYRLCTIAELKVSNIPRPSAWAFQVSSFSRFDIVSLCLQASMRSPRTSRPIRGIVLYTAYSVCQEERVFASHSEFGQQSGSSRKPSIASHGTLVLTRTVCAIKTHTNTVLFPWLAVDQRWHNGKFTFAYFPRESNLPRWNLGTVSRHSRMARCSFL
jgi:hypothetical protein